MAISDSTWGCRRLGTHTRASTVPSAGMPANPATAGTRPSSTASWSGFRTAAGKRNTELEYKIKIENLSEVLTHKARFIILFVLSRY